MIMERQGDLFEKVCVDRHRVTCGRWVKLIRLFCRRRIEAEPAPVKWEGEVTQEEKEKVGR